MQNFTSFLGIFLLMAFAWSISTDRRKINWRVVFWGTLLQLAFACFIFLVPAGSKIFLAVNEAVVKVLDSASAGTRFLFGRLAIPPGMKGEAGEESLGFILAFQALPAIVFFSSLMAALYYIGIMPRLIKLFSVAFTKLMRISGAESLSVSSNIFVGVEANMTVLPYLKTMTKSEFCTILAAGMSTTASSVLALYVFLLHEQFPTIAGHLVSASVISAIAAIVMAKLIVPETETPETLGVHIQPHYEKESSLIDWSLSGLLGHLFYPFALVIGVTPDDAPAIARLIGERAVLTEVTAYRDLAALIQAGTLKDPRSAVLAAYALCGFAHVASLAIFAGGTAALVPSRTRDLSAVGIRALIAATLACLMTAAVAGTFFTSGSILLGK